MTRIDELREGMDSVMTEMVTHLVQWKEITDPNNFRMWLRCVLCQLRYYWRRNEEPLISFCGGQEKGRQNRKKRSKN